MFQNLKLYENQTLNLIQSFKDEGIVQRIDVFDLKIIPLTNHHIDYITRQIDNKELVSQVKQFEKKYDLVKQPYPLPTKDQLQALESYMKEVKPGFFISRITTMFQLLQDFRTFTIGQLEFRSSIYDKKKMINILRQVPMMLSKSAILRRMENSGHFSNDATDEETNDEDLKLKEMFEIFQKLGLNNIEKYSRILRKKHPKLFKSNQCDNWSIQASNLLKLIVNNDEIMEKKREEMIAKFLASIYNTDRYIRYNTNYFENQMDTMGPYLTDSAYSYKITNIKKMRKTDDRIDLFEPMANSPKNREVCHKNDIIKLDELAQFAHQSVNQALGTQSNSAASSAGSHSVGNFSNLFMDILQNTRLLDGDEGGPQCINYSNFSPLMTDEIELEGFLDDSKVIFDEDALIDKETASVLSDERASFDIKSIEWTKQKANDRNLQISLSRIADANLNLIAIFEGDEITILKNVVMQMNYSKQCEYKSLNITQSNQEIDHYILRSNQNTGQQENLKIYLNSSHIGDAFLGSKKIHLPFWSMLHEIYFWYMNQDVTKFINEQQTKNLYYNIFIENFQKQEASVNFISIPSFSRLMDFFNYLNLKLIRIINDQSDVKKNFEPAYSLRNQLTSLRSLIITVISFKFGLSIMEH